MVHKVWVAVHAKRAVVLSEVMLFLRTACLVLAFPIKIAYHMPPNFAIGKAACNPRFIIQILFLTPPLEGSVGYTQLHSRRPAADLTPAPCGHDGFVILAPVLESSPEVDTPGLGRRDPLCLPLAVELPLRLGYIT